jgi:hypothetical protein
MPRTRTFDTNQLTRLQSPGRSLFPMNLLPQQDEYVSCVELRGEHRGILSALPVEFETGHSPAIRKRSDYCGVHRPISQLSPLNARYQQERSRCRFSFLFVQ